MALKQSLTADDKQFFQRVAEAAQSNPFSPQRHKLDLGIANLSPQTPPHLVLSQVIACLANRIAKLEGQGRISLNKFSREEQDILRPALLFDVFHRFADQFDQLIQTQLRSGDTPCAVPFAQEILQLLTLRGCNEEEAVRYLGFFFQMRRAFFFIDRNLVGTSPCVVKLRRQLWSNIFTDDISLYERYLWNRMEEFSTLLLGETGTGKGAAAAAIGRSGFIPFDPQKNRFSESFTRNFISLNLSQFPESLIESELFGHKKGAFTGAIENHSGVFTRCSTHGAIFLDEIGDVSVPIQIKLLQVLQERTFSPVGSHEKTRFQGRVVAATNRPLNELRSTGDFRDDFFFRLCSDVITLPPLRQRLREDANELPLLLNLVIKRIVGEESKDLAALVMDSLAQSPGKDYKWPGNVRELEQAVRRILLKKNYQGEITPAGGSDSNSLKQAIDDGSLNAQQLLSRYCRLLYEKKGTFEEVARITELDRRTVKKHILAEITSQDPNTEKTDL